jgi:hypothetical protein
MGRRGAIAGTWIRGISMQIVVCKMQVAVQKTLQVVYRRFFERGGQWSNFDYIQRWLKRYAEIDAGKIIQSIPETLLKSVDGPDGKPDPLAPMVLSVEGVACCYGSDDDIYNFMAAVKLMAQRYWEYDPPEDKAGCGIPITVEELIVGLALPVTSDPNCAERLIALLEAEGLITTNEYA